MKPVALVNEANSSIYQFLLCFSVNAESEIYIKSKRTLSLPVNFKVEIVNVTFQ